MFSRNVILLIFINSKKMTVTKKFLVLLFLGFGFTFSSHAQNATVQIEQDPVIAELLQLKTEMGKKGTIGDRYRIQIYSGDSNGANEIIKEYRELDMTWLSTLVYETPNYKVWIGNFRNKLEADRALLLIKEIYPAAFRFRPGRK